MVAAPELYSPGVQNAVLCNEEMPLIDPVRVEQERALVNPTIAHAFAYPDAYMRACPHFGLPAPDPIEGEPVHSDVPALIFAGEYDPNTPPEFGRLAAETLPEQLLLRVPRLRSRRALPAGRADRPARLRDAGHGRVPRRSAARTRR